MADLLIAERLYRYVRETVFDRPSGWRGRDCGRWALGWVRACGGPDLSVPYATLRDWRKATCMETAKAEADRLLGLAGWSRGLARTGSVVLVDVEAVPVFGLMGPDGLAVFLGRNGYREARVVPVAAWGP